MANQTVKDARTIHSTNPQYLIEKIIRTRIYESRYWKEDCFGLNAELLVDKSCELRYAGGVYGGNIKPTPFLCLVLKLLQIQPEKDIVIEFLRQEHFKYARALGAFYLRLTGSSLEIWKYLEPLYNDYRKLRYMDRAGLFSVLHMDEYIDQLLREDRVFDIILPRIKKRKVHENLNELELRVSVLEEEIDAAEEEEEEPPSPELVVPKKETLKFKTEKEKFHHKEIDYDSSKHRNRDRDRERYDREKDRDRDYKRREDSPSRYRSHRRSRHERSRSRDRDRRRRSKERRESRSRSRSHSPYSRDRGRDRPSNRSPPREETKSKGKSVADEIAEANALRAKLGLPLLRP